MNMSEIHVTISGPHKVGKSAILQVIAEALANAKVPLCIEGAPLVPGTHQFERLSGVVDTLQASRSTVRLIEAAPPPNCSVCGRSSGHTIGCPNDPM